MGEERAVKNMDMSSFDWNSPHPVFGSPLHAILFGKLIVSADEESDTNELNNGFDDLINADYAERKSRLSLLRFAMKCGADPHVVAPRQCDVSRWWGGECGGDSMKPISFAGRSAFECLLAAKRSIKLRHQDPNDEADWTDELKAVDEAVEILSRSSGAASSSIAVCEGVVNTWESALTDLSSADVVIRVRSSGIKDVDEEVGIGQVLAHSCVLQGSSAVLKAMLSNQSMREGVQRAIEVVGHTVQAVRLLLALVYTGTVSSTDEGPDVPTILNSLDLAHRWQLLHVVTMLASAVSQRVDMDNFEPALDAAMRLELPQLLCSCRAFVASHAREMRQRLAARGGPSYGFQSSAVRAEVEKVLSSEGAEGGAPQKRRRRAL
uniref:BTB domain-containing protein n=1 Tax=Alexandrium catenella TaxID=2925 RepID=A0A7S1S1J6_ALECA